MSTTFAHMLALDLPHWAHVACDPLRLYWEIEVRHPLSGVTLKAQVGPSYDLSAEDRAGEVWKRLWSMYQELDLAHRAARELTRIVR